MTKRQVWRYKCDWCKKANCSSAAIQKHERACTNNPERVCGMCASVEQKSKPLVMLIAIAATVNSAEKLERLKRLAECPACTLAALRQSKILVEAVGWELQFDYEAEVATFWKEHYKAPVHFSRSLCESYGFARLLRGK